MLPVPIAIVGVPFNSDGTPPQEENPPQGLRDIGLVRLLTESGLAVDDRGDLELLAAEGRRDPRTGVLNWLAWSAMSNLLSEEIATILAGPMFPLVLGGDCAILTGAIAGASRHHPRLGLVFVDGHADFHSIDSSPTGEAADLELAVLTGRGPCPITPPAGRAWLSDRDVVAFGIREWDGISATSIRVFDTQSIQRRGPDAVVREALQQLNATLRLWLHFDVDVLDPSLMPVIFPAADGLSFDETEVLLQTIVHSMRVVGMSVACYHPNLDPAGDAAARLASVLVATLTGGPP